MGAAATCPFCDIAKGECQGRTSAVLFQDDRVVAFEDLYPTALKHYLVVPVEHIRNVTYLKKEEHYPIVDQMLKVGLSLLQKDAPNAESYRFGFHKPPFNSVHHLHLHCIALPYKSWWKGVKYASLGCLGGWISAETVLKHLSPSSSSTTTTSV